MFRYRLFSTLLIKISRRSKKKLILIINFFIFLSFFALTSSIITLIYEKKIDDLERKVIQLEGDEIIQKNSILRTNYNIKSSEKILDNHLSKNNYSEILFNLSSDKFRLLNEREKYYETYFPLQYKVSANLKSIKKSISNAMLLASSYEEVSEVENAFNLSKKYDEDFSQLLFKQQQNRIKFSPREDSEKIEYDKYFILYKDYNLTLIKILKEQINFFENFNYTFFSKVGEKNSSLIKDNLENIKKFSNLESKFIFFAFLIQIIIFIMTQILELSFEYQTRRKK